MCMCVRKYYGGIKVSLSIAKCMLENEHILNITKYLKLLLKRYWQQYITLFLGLIFLSVKYIIFNHGCNILYQLSENSVSYLSDILCLLMDNSPLAPSPGFWQSLILWFYWVSQIPHATWNQAVFFLHFASYHP